MKPYYIFIIFIIGYIISFIIGIAYGKHRIRMESQDLESNLDAVESFRETCINDIYTALGNYFQIPVEKIQITGSLSDYNTYSAVAGVKQYLFHFTFLWGRKLKINCTFHHTDFVIVANDSIRLKDGLFNYGRLLIKLVKMDNHFHKQLYKNNVLFDTLCAQTNEAINELKKRNSGDSGVEWLLQIIDNYKIRNKLCKQDAQNLARLMAFLNLNYPKELKDFLQINDVSE